jgi:hypothetical protein
MSSFIVGFQLHGTNVYETIINTVILSGILWAYFSYILYRGLRFDHGKVKWRWPKISISDISDAVSNSGVSIPDLSDGFDVGEGCLGAILGIAVSIIAIIILVVLIYLGVEIGIFVSLIIAIPMYWLFRYSARLVIVNSRKCENNLIKSMMVAIKFAVIYSALMGIIFSLFNYWATKNV